MNNMYWPIYMNLEKEMLDLANRIHFSDDQLNVYSMYIADLIVRAAIEIESLSKELYIGLGGNTNLTDNDGNSRDLFFDTDCIDYLENAWRLSNKQVLISAANMFFANEENTVLFPLKKANKRGTSGSKWKQAYQALKHDRRNALHKATIKNLISSMGALYILNLYYREDKVDLGRVYGHDISFDNRMGSNAFSAYYCKATSINLSQEMNDNNIISLSDDEIAKSIYIIKYNDVSFEAMHKGFCKDEKKTIKNFRSSNEINVFLKNNPEYKNKSINEICLAAGGINLLMKIVNTSFSSKELNAREEAIINKNTKIYPELSLNNDILDDKQL